MDEAELVAWMREVNQRLSRLEVQGDSTPGAPDLPMSQGKLKWQQVSGAYCKRYEKARNLQWHYGPHVQALEDITAWCNSQQGDTVKVAQKLLDAFFADAYAKERDYPPKLLASQCGRYFNPPVVARKDEPDADAINARRLAQARMQREREVEAKLAANRAKPVPPPESLEAMMARIGKTLK